MRKCRCQTVDLINTKFRHGGISKDIDAVALIHVCKYFGRKAIKMRHWAFLLYEKRELCFLQILSFSSVNFQYLIFVKIKKQNLFPEKALCLEIFFFRDLLAHYFSHWSFDIHVGKFNLLLWNSAFIDIYFNQMPLFTGSCCKLLFWQQVPFTCVRCYELSEQG